MKKRALFVATYGDFFSSFLLDKMEILSTFGYEIVCAANFERAEYNQKTDEILSRGIVVKHIPFERKPFSRCNFSAYRKLKKLLKNERFDLLDCHNPVAGALARVAAAKSKKKGNAPFVIYTAHGFFFFKGAGFLARFFYRPIEFWLAKKTDVLITMSKEDFSVAQKMKVKKGVKLVHGMGVDIEKARFLQVDRTTKRAEFGINDEFVAVCVGECIPRKNQTTALCVFAEEGMKGAKLILVGGGEDLPKLKEIAKELGVEKSVIFTGYRKDVIEIVKCADAVLFPSFQEGLSIALIEGMAVGLPVVCSDIRGNRDCVDEGKGGYLFAPSDFLGFARALSALKENPAVREKMGAYNQKRAEDFSKKRVRKEYEEIYGEIALKKE